MSATYPDINLDLREQVARIDRAIAETHKLQAESDKFGSEQRKLAAEAAKLHRDRWLAPVLAAASFVVACGSVVISILTYLAHAHT